MTNRERFERVMNFQPVDRLPVMEWAPYWDQTLERWYAEGLPRELKENVEIHEFFGLDPIYRYRTAPRASSCPGPARHGAGLVEDRDGYLAIKRHLYPEMPFDLELLTKLEPQGIHQPHLKVGDKPAV